MSSRIMRVGCLALLTAVAIVAVPRADDAPRGPFSHVLLISIDGLHAGDVDWYLNDPGLPDESALGWLSAHGRTYTNASATKPSDSFPGMLAMVTGGTPRSTGVYYDDSWDRTALASNVSCSQIPVGAEVQWKQNLDTATLDSGGNPVPWITFVDEGKLPQNPGDCSRVRPHQFPRVNNVFEIIKAAGGRTAWSDKHPAYEFLNGPSGAGLDDLYAPEIASCDGILAGTGTCKSTLVTTNYFSKTIAYDNMKVDAIINEIDGYDHARTNLAGVPTIFGMNFQAVSVGQKLDMTTMGTDLRKGGYQPDGMPSAALQDALRATDVSIGRMINALSRNDLLDSTLIIVSAKHGNMRIDPTAPPGSIPAPGGPMPLVRVDNKKIGLLLSLVAPVAQVSQDTGPLIWLKDPAKTADAVAVLSTADSRVALNLPADGGILSGADLAALYGNPADAQVAARIPDIILVPKPGTLYTLTATKISDHGSFNDDDVHVALLVSNSRLDQMTIDEPVETRQIACTILRALGQSCDALDSERIEPSMCLPPMGWAFGHGK